MKVARWEFAEPPSLCGATRGKRSRTRCELPPDHITGRNGPHQMFEVAHFGRSPSGRWYSWLPEVAA